MCTSFEAVKNIKNGILDRSNVWSVNTEKEYHEEAKSNEMEFVYLQPAQLDGFIMDINPAVGNDIAHGLHLCFIFQVQLGH